jgi:hypothetical protein
MASMAPAAQASRRNSPLRTAIARIDVGTSGASSGVSVWGSRVAGGRGAGNGSLEGLGPRIPTRRRRKRVCAVGSRERNEPRGAKAWNTG